MVDPRLVNVLANMLGPPLVVFCVTLCVACACARRESHPSPEPAPAPVVAATGPSRSDAWPESQNSSPAAQAPEPVVVEQPQLGYFLYSAAAAAAEEDGGVRGASEKVCPICLDALEDGKECSEVPVCGHVYCRDCIALWMRSQSTCPLCRKLIVTGSEPLSAAEEKNKEVAALQPITPVAAFRLHPW